MAEPFLGEIRVFAFGVVPQGWAQCNGQMLNVQGNQGLFSILGNAYGGDGKTTFALPNLQGRVPVAARPTDTVGTCGGEAAHVLTIAEMPAHTHRPSGGADGTTNVAVNNAWGTLGSNVAYAPTGTTMMRGDALSTAGASMAHNNMQPYLAMNFCIALQGIYPPKN